MTFIKYSLTFLIGLSIGLYFYVHYLTKSHVHDVLDIEAVCSEYTETLTAQELKELLPVMRQELQELINSMKQ